jgi:hypothetical protein
VLGDAVVGGSKCSLCQSGCSSCLHSRGVWWRLRQRGTRTWPLPCCCCSSSSFSASAPHVKTPSCKSATPMQPTPQSHSSLALQPLQEYRRGQSVGGQGRREEEGGGRRWEGWVLESFKAAIEDTCVTCVTCCICRGVDTGVPLGVSPCSSQPTPRRQSAVPLPLMSLVPPTRVSDTRTHVLSMRFRCMTQACVFVWVLSRSVRARRGKGHQSCYESVTVCQSRGTSTPPAVVRMPQALPPPPASSLREHRCSDDDAASDVRAASLWSSLLMLHVLSRVS